MRKTNLYKILSCVFISFSVTDCQSQDNFKYKAIFGGIPETGFYKIDLPPKLVAKCKASLDDIRIFDDEGNQASYILKNDLPLFKKEELTEFPIIKTSREKDKLTHIILNNTTGKSLHNLLLFIKNTEASRSFSISGSDDTIHWFIIKENIFLENAFSNDGDNIVKTLSFPTSGYKYFQLIVSGADLLPFNIVKAGIYNEDVVYGKYVEIPKAQIAQKDSSNKKTYVLVQFGDAYQINKIIIRAEGPKYFKRNFSIGTNSKRTDDLIPDALLSSDSTNAFELSCKSSQLSLLVNNEDNIPLKITDVQAFQLNVSLFTYLQSGKKYSVKFGDSALPAPVYDLSFFSDSAEKNPREILLKNIELNGTAIHAANPSDFRINHVILWVIIIAVLFLLSLLTFKMVGEVNKKKGNGL